MAVQTINQSPQITNFVVRAGDTIQFGFSIRNKDTGQLEELTDKVLHCQVRTKQGVEKQNLVLGAGIELTNAPEWDTAARGTQTPVPPVADEDVPDGLAVLTIVGATTEDITICRELKYDLEVTEPDGYVLTHRAGTITGEADVTR